MIRDWILSPKIGENALTISFQYLTQSPNQCNKMKKKKKKHEDQKGRNKTILICRQNDWLYVKKKFKKFSEEASENQ